jgi:hypothetical protein
LRQRAAAADVGIEAASVRFSHAVSLSPWQPARAPHRRSHAAMPIPASILDRIETFRRNLDSYLAPDYKEARVRQEFLDPLFGALGWDVANTAGHAEAYKDVVHEDTLRIPGVGLAAPDYSFRIGGTRKFFVEAKKPSVSLKDDPEPAAQLRRYSFSAKLALGIVTDFQEFAIYDTRIRPREGDKASVARLFYCTYEELPEKWDYLAGIFSRDAVLKGSFDKFAAATKGKRGTSEVDDEFLKDLESWRQRLAENLALRNGDLTQRDLNFAVQRTLDRIIFLRIAEDRGIEPYGQLQALTAGGKIYPRLCEIFERADFRYNSGLFHFAAEKGRDEAPDRLTPGLAVDDAVLKEIFSALYYPKSPYVFTVIPAEILGHVYEQFLGKVIRLTEGHRARVEEKPEVRKAGGVYYTPSYIVDYIVRQTVGPLLADQTPKQVEKLRVLDPACGSGSFLLGAFEFLLDWHLRYYLSHDPAGWAKKKNPPIYETAPNAHGIGQGAKNWQLTTAERKRILTANLYGVDIDPQAVEVTKLSLLLKVLEGEARELQGRQADFHRVLPDLGNNIKCGNSLIGPDFYAQPALPDFDDEARYRINAFDWHDEFKPIMDAGGFDAVIGNPPYVRIQTLQESSPETVDYLTSRYCAAALGNYDLYVCFVEKGLGLLNPSGRLGLILPHKFFNAEYGAPLRRLLAAGGHLSSIVHFGAEQVFAGATTYCCLLFLGKETAKAFEVAQVSNLARWRAGELMPTGKLSSADALAPVWNFTVGSGAELVRRLKALRPKLGEVASIFVGLQTSADDVFILQHRSTRGNKVRAWSKVLAAEVELEAALLRPLVSGTDIQGYQPIGRASLILFPYHVADEKAELISWAELEKSFPRTAAYLLQNKKRLAEREKKKFSDQAWYRFGRSQNLGIQNRPKLCVPRLVSRLRASPDLNGEHFLDNVDVGGVTPIQGKLEMDLRALTALLNSRLLGWFFPSVSAPFRGGWMSANRQFLSEVPIVMPDRVTHEKLVAHVERMLKLHENLAAAKAHDAQTHLRREITATDRAIDQLVYQLYGLTPEEIALVETPPSPANPAELVYAQRDEAESIRRSIVAEDAPAKT